MGRWMCGQIIVWSQFVVILGALLAASCTSPVYRTTWTVPKPPVETYRKHEPVRVGLERELYGLIIRDNGRLRWDDCLAAVAQVRAREMARSGRFDHKDPKTGRNPVWNLVWSCSSYSFAGENLVRGDATPQAMHQALMKSPSHRANLLNPEYQVVGIGCYGNLCVQLFAGY